MQPTELNLAGKTTDTDEESDDLDIIPADDITVAIFCALPYESAAVKYTFDKELQCRPKTVGPRKYVYSFGVIGEHNVVIARPSQMGTVKAAQCAATVSQQFPNVRFALLVGIGAGIPYSSIGGSKRDIRLGDIAVSIPQDGHPGVVEYDYGKYEADGKFVLKGSLDKPHPILISADSALQEDEIMNKNRFRKTLGKIIEKPGYARPESDDILFDETFRHVEGVDCSQCLKDGPQKVITRDTKSTKPVVHRGLILSGSGVVKNPEDRLRLLRGYTDVICFEMEAAGIVDEIPCLVVRGICDYADTHKQDGWHYYAAAVAAAYGKALLLKIYGEDIQEAESMKETMSQVLSLSINTNTRVQSLQASAHLDKIVQWLSAPDPSTNLNAAWELHQPGTGQWLLESEKYKSWKANRGSFLWLYGIPGCGKTILSSTIVADLDSDPTTSPNLLYFYFNFTDVEKRSTENAVRSLIEQLYRKNLKTREVLDTLYEKGQRQLTGSSLQNALRIMISRCHDIWITLDGLDECETREEHGSNSVMVWVKELRCLPNIRVLITSRPEEDIRSCFAAWVNPDESVPLQSHLVKDDINAYIRTKVTQMARWQTQPEIQTLIVNSLSERADGMFRWVACQFDTLDRCLSRKDLLRELAALPRTLDETYERIFERIYPEYKPITIRLLQLLAYSPRPLRIDEAVDAIAIEPASSPRFDMRNRVQIPEEIIRYCSTFVSLTTHPPSDLSGRKQVAEIQLAHFSVQEYLQSNRLQQPLSEQLNKTAAAAAIVELCLSYLLELSNLREWQTWPPTQSTRNLYPFVRFSASYWSKFAVIVESSNKKALNIVEEYYASQQAFSLGRRLCPTDYWRQHHPDDGRLCGPLYHASFSGLLHSVHIILKTEKDINRSCGHRGTALHAASYQGHEEIVEMLLQNGANVNKLGRLGSALVDAASKGHQRIVEILLEAGADPNIFGLLGSALRGAASQGHQRIVEILLQRGVDINSQAQPALSTASGGGHEEIVEILLRNGADVNARSEYFDSALCTASERGKQKIVEILLQNGADINAQCKWHGNALQAALCKGHLEIAELLLQRGVDINTLSGIYNYALQAVSADGYLEVVKWLLEKGADVDAQSDYYGSALQGGSFEGHDSIVQMLIQSGAHVNAQGGEHGNALQAASCGGHDSIVQMLIQSGADVNAQGGQHSNALHAASYGGHDSIVQTLIQSGANVNVQGGEHGSALRAALHGGYDGIVQILLDNGAVDTQEEWSDPSSSDAEVEGIY